MALKDGNISRIVWPNYLEAIHAFTMTKNYLAEYDVAVLGKIDHPLSIGIGVFDDKDMHPSLYKCLNLLFKMDMFEVWFIILTILLCLTPANFTAFNIWQFYSV